MKRVLEIKKFLRLSGRRDDALAFTRVALQELAKGPGFLKALRQQKEAEMVEPASVPRVSYFLPAALASHLRDLVTYALVEADISTRDSEIIRLALNKVELNQRFLELFDEDKRASNANRNRARNEAE
jgi:hypothetical protein